MRMPTALATTSVILMVLAGGPLLADDVLIAATPTATTPTVEPLLVPHEPLPLEPLPIADVACPAPNEPLPPLAIPAEPLALFCTKEVCSVNRQDCRNGCLPCGFSFQCNFPGCYSCQCIC